MGIVEEDIARVRAATDFVALASEHMALKRVGVQWMGCCPFHAEKSPSFSLNAEQGLYYCFGCQAKGDVITFVREIEHLDFAEAVEALASRANISLRYDDEATGRDHQRLARIHDTLERAVAWYHERLLNAPDAATARRYLRTERGYDSDLVRQFRLGWAPEGWDTLIRSLKLPPNALVDAGLARVGDRGRYTDFFRGRILFPIFDAGGRAIGAGGRIMPGASGPKYRNTANTAVYDKSKVVYGLNWAKQSIVRSGRIVMCEGYTDVIGLQRAGIGEAVATCGTSLADGHVRLLTKFGRRIVLAYDADGAGQAAAERFYEWEQRYEADIRVAALPEGQDPADLARRDPAGLAQAIEEARPFLSFQLERLFARSELSTAEGRVRAAGAAMALVSAHPNDLVRDQYVMEVADQCRIAPERLRTLPPPAADTAPRPGASSRRSTSRREGWEDDGRELVERAVASVPPIEQVALRLAVHHPEEVADRLDLILFSHPLAVSTFCALADAATLHEAISGADPQTADFLQRLAVDPVDESADDVMARLLEAAGQRAYEDLLAEFRAAPPEQQPAYVDTLQWVRRAKDSLRTADGPLGRDADPELAAERGLVAWLLARHEAVSQQAEGAEVGVVGP